MSEMITDFLIFPFLLNYLKVLLEMDHDVINFSYRNFINKNLIKNKKI